MPILEDCSSSHSSWLLTLLGYQPEGIDLLPFSMPPHALPRDLFESGTTATGVDRLIERWDLALVDIDQRSDSLSVRLPLCYWPLCWCVSHAAHHRRLGRRGANHDSHAGLLRARTALISASTAEAGIRSVPRRAACLCRRESDSCAFAWRMARAVSLSSSSSIPRRIAIGLPFVVSTRSPWMARLRTYPVDSANGACSGTHRLAPFCKCSHYGYDIATQAASHADSDD